MSSVDKILYKYPLFENSISYSVSIRNHDKMGSEEAQNKVDFLFNIEIMSNPKEEPIIVRYQKNKLQFNDLDILQGFDDIAMETGKAFWMLDLLLDKDGAILDIKNKKEIVRFWDEKRKYVEMTYKGYIVKEFLDDMEFRVHDEDKLVKSLLSDYTLSFFFKDLYGEYEQNGYGNISSKSYKSVFYNLIGDAAISYIEAREVKYDNDKYVVNVKGNHMKAEGLKKIVELLFKSVKYDESNFSSSYTCCYELDREGLIEQMILSIETSYDQLIMKQTEICINIQNGLR